MFKLKEELEKLKRSANLDFKWYNQYKKLVDPKGLQKEFADPFLRTDSQTKKRRVSCTTIGGVAAVSDGDNHHGLNHII